MSAAQLKKRALVTLLLTLARLYSLDINLTRDSADEFVKKAFRKVILKAHPDKGGSEEAMKKLNEAWAEWTEASKAKKKPGRQLNSEA